MSIEEQLLQDMKLAMKAGKKLELETVRILRAQIKTASIDKKDDFGVGSGTIVNIIIEK